MEDLTGGRIQTILHMPNLLQKHNLFTWENYGEKWEINHIFPLERVDRYSISDRYRVNNWSNLEPKLPDNNKKERYATLDNASNTTDESPEC
jgi:hypothetical protein